LIDIENKSFKDSIEGVFNLIQLQEQRSDADSGSVSGFVKSNLEPDKVIETDPVLAKVVQIYEKFKDQLI
jgi:hypothetical protein